MICGVAKIANVKNMRNYVREYINKKKDDTEEKNDSYKSKIINSLLEEKYNSYYVHDFIEMLLKFKCCDMLEHMYINIFNDLGYVDIAATNLFYISV